MRWYNFFHIYQPPAWSETIVRRVADESYRPLMNILRRHPDVRITMNITGSLAEILGALNLVDIIQDISTFVATGQIELVGSAMYHPILPLIPRAERKRQFDLQQRVLEQLFGVKKPRGCYLPEMAYDSSLDRDVLEQGFSWVVLDECCAGKGIGIIDLNQPYISPSGLIIIFRNREMSDWLSFQADPNNLLAAKETLEHDHRSQTSLITALDGENLGHHRHGADQLWEQLVTGPGIETATLSSFAQQPPIPIQALAGSWSSLSSELASHIPFGLWNHPSNPIHKLQWELTYLITQTVEAATADPYYPSARRLLDRALASDRYWWASAQPWWDLPIIIRETQKLADVIDPLDVVPENVRHTVERLMEEITAMVNTWEQTGVAKRRQASYLQDGEKVLYMAGNALS